MSCRPMFSLNFVNAKIVCRPRNSNVSVTSLSQCANAVARNSEVDPGCQAAKVVLFVGAKHSFLLCQHQCSKVYYVSGVFSV
jgi:hypothetical protein